ncbi:AAA family ATPase [Garciella nitratireducens]|uniref:AAA family ATPase n=1 Tax=Garciella nitratireducens TaxID=218205 RepID=UPI000DE95DB5|nr:AAA family ATPase [Garciella nitratireducens]RBP37427.1 exonuclease SbcC [Garciella nitratireducens]
MKPLLLKVSGINSFMEEQTIDFRELTEMGVFGIFGPTGSGKSTILDAIILALYGEIPRSSKKNDLSGIINSQCDRGKVYYEFGIGNGKKRKIYFVSRTFKKDKQGSVKSNGVKLCDITNEENPIVLEEKVNDVNRKILEIIGLNCEDFTRSVVLPQGKFSDFLRLNGKDRRDMLERIFALQEYGTQLSQKLSNYKKKIEQEYSFIDGKFRTYEGISKEHDDELQKEIETLKRKYDKAEKEDQEIEKKYQVSKKLRELTLKLKENLKKQENLKRQALQIKEDKMRYELAEQVKNIQPYIEQQKNLREQTIEKEQIKEKNNKDLDRVSSILEKVQKNWDRQQKRKEEEIPYLLKEKERMEFALKKQRKMQKLFVHLEQATKQKEKAQQEWEQIQKNLENLEKQMIKLTQKIKETQKFTRSLEVSSQYRRKLYEAYEIEKEYYKFLEQKRELYEICDSNQKELELMKQEHEKIEQQIQQAQKQLEQSKKEEEKIQNQIQQIYRQNMAFSLAKDLKEGQCCPVCGSKEHPFKAKSIENQEIETLEENKAFLEKNIEKIQLFLEEKRTFLQKKITEIFIKKEILQDGQEKYQEFQKNLTILKEKLIIIKKELEIEEIEKNLRKLQQQELHLEKLQKEIQGCQRKKEEQENQRNNLLEKYNDAFRQFTQWTQRSEELKKQIQELQQEIERDCGEKDPEKEIKLIGQEIDFIEREYQKSKKDFEFYFTQKIDLEKKQRGLEDTLQQLYEHRDTIKTTLESMLKENGFKNIKEVSSYFKDQKERQELKKKIREYEDQVFLINENIKSLEKSLNGQIIENSDWEKIQQKREDSKKRLEILQMSLIEKNTLKKDIQGRLKELEIVLEQKKKIEHKKALLQDLSNLLKGNEFVEFISTGQLRYIAKEASQQLKKITRGRYALELDSNGNFIVRDDFHGGIRRSTQTLSGGETFLTSLSLALALSSHIQLKGNAHLEFFFLDEGFGTLDAELLETVMDSLEKLQSNQLSVGLISHVEELKQRIPRKLIVQPAIPGVRGTKVILERG